MRFFSPNMGNILKDFTKTAKRLEDFIADREARRSENDGLIAAHLTGIESLNVANNRLNAEKDTATRVLANVNALISPADEA
ncbi:hypothetical protein [Pyruvatibacter mobilis]|uniref:hypothetical protein n=1 Tax=Pyruvatibacter mobilis TaxID=1712261 RepID=UPI003BA97911